MEKRAANRNSGALIPTLSVFFAALAGVPALLLAYRLIDGFSDLTQNARSLFPLSAAGLFIVFLGLQGVAAGLLSSTMEKKPLSFLPHLCAPAVFASSLGLGALILGRFSLPESLMSLIFYLSGFLLFRARSKKQGKKTCVLYAAVPAVVLATGVFFLRAFMNSAAGTSALSQTVSSLENIADQIGRSLSSSLRTLAGSHAEEILKQTLTPTALAGKTVDEGYALLGDVYAETCRIVLRVLPAVAVAAFNIYGFVAASVCNMSSLFRRDKVEWRLTVSGIGTLIFLASMFVTALFISLGSSGGFGLFLYSMRIVFLPAFMGVGAGTIAGMRKDQWSRHILLTVACAVLILISPFVTLPMIGVYGNTARIVNDKKRQMNDGNGPDLPKL